MSNDPARADVEVTQHDTGMNALLFREVNERIRELRTGGKFVEFICECADQACTVVVRLSLAEYEEVRRFPARFLVAPGHGAPDERLVDSKDRYVVVEKTGVAGEAAHKLDPRERRRRSKASRRLAAM